MHTMHFLPTRFVVGAKSLTQPDLEASLSGPIEEVIEQEHATDAHFICYALRSGDEMPRVNKVCLPQIRAAGDDLLLRLAAVDIDRVPHEPWRDAEEAWDFLAMLQDYAEGLWAPGAKWRYAYTSKQGARLVYVLDRALSPEDWEVFVAGLVLELKSEFPGADEHCGDWTRSFRLPHVVRDGVRQSGEPWFGMLRQPGVVYPVGKLPERRVASVQQALDVPEFKHKKPTIDEAAALLVRIASNGRQCESHWLRNAKTALKNESYYPALFEHVPLAPKGGRDDALIECVGSIVSLLHGKYGTTPDRIYAIVLDAALGFIPDAGTPDWTDSLWQKIGYVWSREEAKAEVRRKEEAKKQASTTTLIHRIIEGMREWCDDPRLYESIDGSISSDAIDFILSHFIAMTPSGKDIYLLGPDGRFIQQALAPSAVVPKINQVYGPDNGIVPTVVQTPTGVRTLSHVDIINAHATIVSHVEHRAAGEEGGVIESVDEPWARLSLASFSRNPVLVPTFDPAVDEWLRLFFGENYDLAARWIAWAIAFEEGPICALSILGPPGTGKTLLAEGLKETLRRPKASLFSDVTGDWQYDLADSPFVFADENIEEAVGRSHPADVFRRIIGRSSEMRANKKFASPISVATDVRVLFTSNNYNLMRMLATKRELSPEDRAALAMRLLHVETTDEAAEWLKANGGRKYTRGWISDGRSSDYRVAKHFLHLHEARESFGRGDRLLVEGNMSPKAMNELRLHSGSMDRVVQAVIQMVNAAPLSATRKELRIVGDRIYVLPSDVHRHIIENLNQPNVRISQVRELLASLVANDTVNGLGTVRALTLDGDRRRWYSPDTRFLYDVGVQYGWDIERIGRILDGTYVERDEPQVPGISHPTAKKGWLA